VARFSGGNADIVRTFSEGLGMYAYYGPKTVTGTFGIALLSRYPIQNPSTFFMYSEGEQTASIQAQIIVNGKTYQILVTHLGNDGPIIQQQQVLERLAGLQNVIAMGDFNFDQTSEQYALTTQTLEDAWVSAGSPPAAGLDMGHLIDHIFVSPGMDVQLAQYIVSPVSDHPALLVEIGP
jgi:endonuclease/exonuclease/phosphatase family metal-dependent hydrolase